MAATKYWYNKYTGEYRTSPENPSGSTTKTKGWEPASQSYVTKMKQQEMAATAEKDRTAQQKREAGGIAELKKAIALFDKDYGKGMEARARASASSAAVASGLGGTTRPGAVSAGTMAEWEDIRRGRLAGAQSELASFLGSYRDPYGITPQVELGQQQLGLGQRQLTQQGRQAGQQLDFNYAQLEQQQYQFAEELGLGYANLAAKGGQPAQVPQISDSIWEPLNTGGGGGGTFRPSPTAYTGLEKTYEELYQGGWTG